MHSISGFWQRQKLKHSFQIGSIALVDKKMVRCFRRMVALLTSDIFGWEGTQWIFRQIVMSSNYLGKQVTFCGFNYGYYLNLYGTPGPNSKYYTLFTSFVQEYLHAPLITSLLRFFKNQAEDFHHTHLFIISTLTILLYSSRLSNIQRVTGKPQK